jgi:flagellar biosynthesis protein FliR
VTVIENPVIPFFVLFCRVGGCLMVAPGFSSDRVPTRVRLYIALAVTLALAPPFLDKMKGALTHGEPTRLVMTLMAELAVGVTLGLLARMYFFALETLATSVAMTFGLGNIFGTPITESEPAPPFRPSSSFARLRWFSSRICISKSFARFISPTRQRPFSRRPKRMRS